MALTPALQGHNLHFQTEAVHAKGGTAGGPTKLPRCRQFDAMADVCRAP
jgi:hypothetical protein